MILNEKNENKDNEKVYRYSTRSIYEFTVCLALGATIVSVDRETDPRHFEFTVESKTIDLEKKALELASRTLVMNAYELLDAYGRAKSVVHSNTGLYKR